jgi:RNA polymerase sigma factor (sigma-70 family)
MTDAADRPEAELLADIAKGDDAAFAVFYRRYLPVVLRWCLRQTGSRELASDLSAEVFATALIASRRYRPESGSVVAWLLGIARNKLSESRRRGRVENAARRRLGLERIAITDADLERVEELASLDDGILARIADLPEDQRNAIVGRIIDERPYDEIASELSCSESVVRQRVSRGLKTLRNQVEKR